MKLPTLAVCLAAPLAAQGHLVIPSSAPAGDANSGLQIAGFDHDARQQILVDSGHLVGVLGLDVTALAFRRDASWFRPMRAGASDLTVVLSVSPRRPVDASALFEENVDPSPVDRVTVFQGRIALPHSAEPAGRTVGWSEAQDVVEIAFTTPFAYRGGTLCVDITGTRVTGSESKIWGVDAVSDPAVGAVASIGQTCVAGLPPALVADYSLVAGSTARFRAGGPTGSGGAFFVGLPMPAFDLSLLALAPFGCELHVDPFVTVPTHFAPLAGNPAIGAAEVPIQIPAAPSSLGFAFRSQFIALSASLVTTNALDATIAPQSPSLGMATVSADWVGASPPTAGVVRSNRAPVLRLAVE